jgi:20S proteasome subunit alpha 7
MSGSGHDQSTDTFSTDGRVFQVEYACKAVDNSSTAIGICCRDGVVVACEKVLVSRMLEATSNNRIHCVDRQAGICICGNLPDGKSLVTKSREEAQQSRTIMNSPILGSVLSERVGEMIHLYTIYGGLRPYGCSVLIASYADDGPQLFVADPSGTTAGYRGIALGKAKTVAKTELEKLNFSQLTCRDAVQKVVAILHDVHDKTKDKLYDIEVGWVCDESNRVFQHVPDHLIPKTP